MTSELATRLPELEVEAESLERRARALRQIVEGIKALNGDASAILFGPVEENAPKVDEEPGPVGKEAVRLIVATRPGVWKVSAIRDEARRRGYSISAMGVEKAVRRMVDSGEATKAGYGLYRFGARREGTLLDAA